MSTSSTAKAKTGLGRTVRETAFWRTLRASLLGLALLVAWSLTFILLPSPARFRIEIGEPSPRDIKAPRRVTYISQVKTEEARNAAAERVEDVYTAPDMDIAAQQLQHLEQILTNITSVRNDRAAEPQEKIEFLSEMPGLQLSSSLLPRIVSMTEEEWQAVASEAIRVLDIIMRDEVRETQVATKAQQAYRLSKSDLSPGQREIVAELVSGFVIPNSFLDVEETAARRQAAREAIEPIQSTIRAGESIVREGEIVTPVAYEKLQVLDLLEQERDWQQIGGHILLATALVAVVAGYVALCQPDLLERPRRLLLLLLTLIVSGLAAQLAIPGHVLLPYLLPVAAASMLIAGLLNVELGVFVAGMLTVLMAVNAGASPELVIYALLGSLVGAISMVSVDQVDGFVRAGAYVALTNVAVVTSFQLQDQIHDMTGLLQLLGASAINGALSASLAFIVFALAGRFFGVTTFVELLELARPTHPLLRQLLIKAPGTYHHSLLVSNMAERAAEAIGADSLLARVGSYYHDVGKILRPFFFAENQASGNNPHSNLDPRTSAEIIIAHAVEGLDLAHRYHLPQRVCDFIPEHHGTTFVSYFYGQATADKDETVCEDDYRYPGPRPQSRETAIVMLADSVEAIVRAKHPDSEDEMERLIHKVILDRLTSGELDESDLTMSDLSAIRAAFIHVLRGIFHPRIDYPNLSDTAKPTAAPQASQTSAGDL